MTLPAWFTFYDEPEMERRVTSRSILCTEQAFLDGDLDWPYAGVAPPLPTTGDADD